MKAAKLIGKDGEPKYTPHALRHFFACWCINPKARGGRELPPKQVQYLLGHSTISMTFDIYGHLFPSEGNRDELTAAVRQLLAKMPRDSATIFGDLIGKLDVLRVSCDKCV